MSTEQRWHLKSTNLFVLLLLRNS